HADADGTRDAGAAETTVTVGILGEVLLVVLLGVVELRRRQHFGGDLTVADGCQPLLIRVARSLRGVLLFVVVIVDAGAVLRADVVALPHTLRRIVILPAHLQ